MVAAGDGNIDVVKRFLDSGVSPNAQDSSGYSPLLVLWWMFILDMLLLRTGILTF